MMMTHVLLLYIVICILVTLSSISIVLILRYYKKRIELISETILRDPEPPSATMDGNERIKYTNDLLTFIDNTITSELLNEKRFDIFLHQKNKNLDFDEVLRNVSTNTFNALQEDVLVDPNLIIKSEYLMRYIQKRTFVIYFKYIENNVADQL